VLVADYQNGAPCLVRHAQAWEHQTGAVAVGSHWTEAAEQACSSARAQVWEHRVLEVGDYQNGVPFPCLHAHVQVPEWETAVAVAAWCQTGVEEDVCLGSRDQAWEHQALTVEEYQNGVPCLCLCPLVWETEAQEKGWYQTVVAVACFQLVGCRLGEVVGRMFHSAGTWEAVAAAGESSRPN